jgi:uncharacterized protein
MQRVIITGGSGYIGRRLVQALKDSYEVVVLSRAPEKNSVPGARMAGWDGKSAQGWGSLADGAFAILNLAGENIGAQPWTAARKEAILGSRLNAGNAVVEAVRAAGVKPGLLIQQSGIGYYGNAPQPVDEEAPPGDDFAARVCRQWEASTTEVEAMGVRRVVTRTAVLIDPQGPALGRMMIPFRLFAGGPLGDGKQPFPWIHPADSIASYRFFMENASTRGVYNVVAPGVVTNGQFARRLGQVMGRPSWLPAPAFALKLALGEMSVIVLEGQNAKADKLLNAGFKFRFPDADSALRDLLP